MIHADQVMPVLVAAVPSFAEQWSALEADPLHAGEDGEPRLHHLDAGAFARHLVGLRRLGAHDELRAAFAAIETLHVEGDDFVRELATIGYLEGVQNVSSHAPDVRDTDFETYLGPESRRWWDGLNALWSGRAPTVAADTDGA